VALNNAISLNVPIDNITSSQDLMPQTLKTLVDIGMPLMKNDLSEAQLSVWLDYSREMLRVATNDKASSIYINYLQLILTLGSTKLTPYQKLYYCLQYLLEITKIIFN